MITLFITTLPKWEQKPWNGTLINVASFMFCSFLNDAKDLKIRAGEWDTQTTKERLPFQERIASRIFSHPQYNERSLANDVAIIELEDPFQLKEHINTICLPPSGYVSTSRNCFASGWGWVKCSVQMSYKKWFSYRKDVFGKSGKFSVIQKKVLLPIVPFNQCQTALQQTRLTSKFRLDPSVRGTDDCFTIFTTIFLFQFLCAGGEPGVDTCQVNHHQWMSLRQLTFLIFLGWWWSTARMSSWKSITKPLLSKWHCCMGDWLSWGSSSSLCKCRFGSRLDWLSNPVYWPRHKLLHLLNFLRLFNVK